MDSTTGMRPTVLIAVSKEQWLASALGGDRFAVIQVQSGTLARDLAGDVRPDVIILEADLPDMSGIDACRLLHADPQIGHHVPILIVARDKPTPEQRVTALRAGVWDFLRYPRDSEELSLTLQVYVQAKRNIDAAMAEDLAGPTTAAQTGVVLAPFRAGQMEENLGRFIQARAWYEVALRGAEGLRDRRPEVESLRALGYVCLALGNCAEGSRYFQRSLALAEAEFDQAGAIDACKALGDAALAQEQWAGARAWYSRGLRLADAAGDAARPAAGQPV